MHYFFFLFLFVAVPAALPAALPTAAQMIPGFGGDRNEPIKISSEELTIDRVAHEALFSGQVEVSQSGLTITSLRMNLLYENAPDVRIKFLYASGNVKLVGQATDTQPAPTAIGDLAEYNMDTHTLILTGKVVLERDGQILTGQSLVIDTISGQSRLDSIEQGKPGRVRGLFKPSKKGSEKKSSTK